jgi:outer membrane protein assembly factor BamE (lipoprotein component of BamABCDE complex)
MFRKASNKTLNTFNLLKISLVLLAIPACIKNTELVGYTFKSEKIDQIKVGSTSQDYVKNTLGSPSIVSVYGDSTWYYISTEYETIAFLKPKVKNQQVVAIKFDSDNTVSDIKQYSAKDAKDIKLISDTTRTGDSDISLIEQLLGNVGRFNSEPGKPKTITKPRSVPK